MRKLCLLFLLLIPALIRAQESNQEFIGTAGEYTETSNGSLSWAIGETITGTITEGPGLITQGFKQGYLTVEQIDDGNGEISYFKVYPNPTSDILIIEAEEAGINYQLINIQGQVLKNGKTENILEGLDLTTFTSGVYILKINNRQKFKIVKQ